MPELTSLEICAGGGGQALGLEQAGFRHLALVDNDSHACATLRLNRPNWNVIEGDVKAFSARPYEGVDLLAGGVPCPPFSKAGIQLGKDDERDLFPQALRLVAECKPRAVLLENVRGLLDKAFDQYRDDISKELKRLGYIPDWRLLQASGFGVPQLRPRVLLMALHETVCSSFIWPEPNLEPLVTVGDALYELMAAGGWTGAALWRERANRVGPTIVGGSKKHGGPDLGPSRAKREWETLGVNGRLIGNAPPDHTFPADGLPTLTVDMVARVQGFPSDWLFSGKKTGAYRQVGNAFPPPVARAVGVQIAACLQNQPARTLRVEDMTQVHADTSVSSGESASFCRGEETLSRDLASVGSSGQHRRSSQQRR